MTADPFGLRSISVESLRERPGVKWQRDAGLLASWVADMDFPVSPAVTERLRAVVDQGVFGYPHWPHGRSPAADAFVRRMQRRYGWTIDPDHLHEVADVVQGVRMAIGLMSSPGDGIALHLPAYHPFLHTMPMMDRRPIALPFDAANACDVLERERPAMIILCHPHNPTGVVFSRSDLEMLAATADRLGIWVISDEIHSDLVFAPDEHVPFATVSPQAVARTITVTSASKAFNLAGLRWAIVHAGPEEFTAAVAQHPSHWFGAPNQMAVEATVAAWDEGEPWLAAVMEVLNENRQALSDLLATHLPGALYSPPQATYLAWVDCSMIGPGDAPYELFRSRGVEVSPGTQFGDGGSGHVRLNLATSPEVLAQVVRTMGGH